MSNSTVADNSTFKIISSDGKQFEISFKAAKQSTMLSTMLERFTPEMMAGLDIQNVDGKTLESVIKWCEHHKDDEPFVQPVETHQPKVFLPWDKKFLNGLNNMALYHVVNAANFLDIKGLLDLGCEQAANMMRGKSPDELSQLFGLLQVDQQKKADRKTAGKAEKEVESAETAKSSRASRAEKRAAMKN